MLAQARPAARMMTLLAELAELPDGATLDADLVLHDVLEAIGDDAPMAQARLAPDVAEEVAQHGVGDPLEVLTLQVEHATREEVEEAFREINQVKYLIRERLKYRTMPRDRALWLQLDAAIGGLMATLPRVYTEAAVDVLARG